jgi:hypothetical protein
MRMPPDRNPETVSPLKNTRPEKIYLKNTSVKNIYLENIHQKKMHAENNPRTTIGGPCNEKTKQRIYSA